MSIQRFADDRMIDILKKNGKDTFLPLYIDDVLELKKLLEENQQTKLPLPMPYEASMDEKELEEFHDFKNAKESGTYLYCPFKSGDEVLGTILNGKPRKESVIGMSYEEGMLYIRTRVQEGAEKGIIVDRLPEEVKKVKN